jgi:mono/diheme cytochrome c family protein
MKNLRQLVLSVGLLATTAVGLGPLRAQNVGGNIESGRALAQAWCAQCHSFGRDRAGIFAADFVEVANLPSTTALSLRVFLQSNHKDMPNFSLKPAEADDIITFILSLKRR